VGLEEDFVALASLAGIVVIVSTFSFLFSVRAFVRSK